MAIFYILEWLFVIVFFLTFLLLSLWVLGRFISKSHFKEIPKDILKDVEQALQIKDNSIFYNLGCGDGRVLFYLFGRNKKAEYLGTEENPYSFFIANIKNFFTRTDNKKKIKIFYKDFFKEDLSRATHLFTYFHPNIMDDLLPKLEKELKEGASLVSLNFKFTQKRYFEKIEILNNKKEVNHKIYVYKF